MQRGAREPGLQLVQVAVEEAQARHGEEEGEARHALRLLCARNAEPASETALERERERR